MMPERIGTMGRQQGVKDSSRPRPAKVSITTARLPLPIMAASWSCSEITGAAPTLAPVSIVAMAAAVLTVSNSVCGG